MRGTDFSPKPSPGDRPQSTAEQARLDDAIRRADDLLVSSLKTEERRRKKRLTIIILSGGIAMLTIVCAAVLMLAPGAPPATQAAGKASVAGVDRSDQLTAEGWKLWQGQQFDPAIKKFREAVKLAPKNTNAWNGLGWAQFNSGEVDEAVKAFHKVIALESKHPAALNGLGQIALSKRDYKNAEKYLLKAAPQASAAWYGLARLYLLEGKFNDARKWAKKIVDTGEADEVAKQMLAAAEARKLDDSLRRMIEPLAAAADDGAAAKSLKHSAKGWQLFNQGRNAEAKGEFAAALEFDPENGAAQNGMGWALLNSGEAKQAKPYFEKIVAAEPDAGGAVNGLARILKIEGDVDGAVKLWEGMLKSTPAPNAATVGLAEVYFEREQYDKAIPLFEQLAKAMPANEQFQKMLAAAREKAGK